MFIRGVRIDLIDDHFQAERVGLFDDPVKIGKAAKAGIDPAVIGHVIAEIAHGGGEKRRNPDAVHAQIGDVIQPFDDARKVADPVTCGVTEASRIDLINHRAAPPLRIVVDGCGSSANRSCH